MSAGSIAQLFELIPRAQALWANEATRPGLLFLGAAALIYFVPTNSKRATTRQSPSGPQDSAQDRPTNTPLLRRVLWRLRPPTDLMRVDGVTIDRSRQPHCAWLAPTGGGKSSGVAAVRVDGKRPTLIVTPDISDPLREATLRLGGLVWTACESQYAIDFLIGTPTEVAERLTEVFRSGGVGAWKRAARRATAAVIRDLDAHQQPRSLLTIGFGLAAAVKSDRELRTVCAGWVERFLDLADQFGPSIGAGGLDLAELLNQNKTVLLENDAFEHPALVEDIVALGLAEAKRCTRRVPQGFRLIFEEAGQLNERIELAAPFFRAGRRRFVAVDVLTQAESDLEYHGSDAITANLGTRIYFAQELKSLQKVAADRLGIDYRELDPANMRAFSAWLSHGKIRRLIHFPKPARSSYVSVPTPEPEATSPARRYIVREIQRSRPSLPMLPMPPLEVQEILRKIERPYGIDGCWLWTGDKDKDGYGVQRWPYPNGKKNNRPAHQVVWEIINSRWFPREPNGKSWDWDHRRTCPRHCVNPGHGEPKTHGDNVRAMHRTRGHVTAAD